MTASATHRLRMAKLSRSRTRVAELLAELAQEMAEDAKVFAEMADGVTVDMATGKRRPRLTVPEIPQPTELAKARAARALQDAALRRRLR